MKKVLIIITAVMSAVIITGSGIAKLISLKGPVQMLMNLGIGPYIRLLGITEIILTALIIIPKTRRVGFILLCCYFGGAIATVISHQGSFLNPALIPLVLIWVNMALTDPALFISIKQKKSC